jgi:hypothetical protein
VCVTVLGGDMRIRASESQVVVFQRLGFWAHGQCIEFYIASVLFGGSRSVLSGLDIAL